MFANRRNDSALDREIKLALAELEKHRDEPDKYKATADRVAMLQKLKSERGLKPPSLDTVLVVGANIFGILWLARYESDGNLIKSRTALGFVMRPRPNQ